MTDSRAGEMGRGMLMADFAYDLSLGGLILGHDLGYAFSDHDPTALFPTTISLPSPDLLPARSCVLLSTHSFIYVYGMLTWCRHRARCEGSAVNKSNHTFSLMEFIF